MEKKTDVINIASIRVAGIGGLGLVAIAVAVAWSIPRIGQTVVLSAVLGFALAVGLILWRRHRGPMPTSGEHTGANTTLSIDDATGPAVEERSDGDRIHRDDALYSSPGRS